MNYLWNFNSILKLLPSLVESMNSYGKLVAMSSVLIVFNYMVLLNHWTTSSQNDIPKVQPCHRKDGCFLSEPAKEPEKIVEAKKEKENSQGTVEITSVLTPVHKHYINRVSLSQDYKH